MKVGVWIFALTITLTVVISEVALANRFERLQIQIDNINTKITNLQDDSEQHITRDEIAPMQEVVDKLYDDVEQLKREPWNISRGGDRSRIMRVTAYDLSVESCGKLPNHPEYGITASGEHVKEWYTVAAGPDMPFGTKIYIPYFRDKPNRGMFTVKDRGSAIKNGCIDVYMASNKECDRFGVKYLEVYVLKGDTDG